MRLPRNCLLFGLALLIAATHAAAQDGGPAPVEVTGIGQHPITLTQGDLARLPAIEMDVTYETSKGSVHGRYSGVLLWDVFVAQRAFDDGEHSAELVRTFVVRGRDGYRIAFSVGEIHPDFGNTPLMLADKVDGKQIESGYRLIVPGDKRGARNVRDVVEIDLR